MMDTAVSILKALVRAAPAVLPELVKLLESIRKAKDPVEAAKRAAKAAGAPLAAKAAANTALKAAAALRKNIKKKP